jgi:hypothetical protein
MKIIPFGPDPFYKKKIIFSYDLFEKLQYTRNSHIRLNNRISTVPKPTKNDVGCSVGFLECLLKKPKVYNERKKREKNIFPLASPQKSFFGCI